MRLLEQTFAVTKSMFDMPLTLYGFTFSFWKIMLWSMVAGLLIWFLWRCFFDD